jgi:hypothetical protein
VSVSILSQSKLTIASLASRQGTVNSFSKIKKYFPYGRWLGEDNRYSRQTTDRLYDDVVNLSINHKHLAEYIAASVPLHCLDGWSFLARAVSSHLAGDADHSRHLAYYAELRAAMSLLAAEGFGIFRNRHIVVDASGNCHRLPGDDNTHFIAWALLSFWSGTTAAANLLGRVLAPAGKRLSDWATGFSAGPAAALVGADWLKSWGVDIQRFAEDREARNEASYRPSRIYRTSQLDSWNAAKFLPSIWGVFEPSSTIRSSQLDRFLLRILLERTFRAVYGYWKKAEFRLRLQRTFGSLGFSDLMRAEWEGFLLRNVLPEDSFVISEALKKDALGSARHHLQVICRAALLLRVASGACANLLREADINKDDIRFWWLSLGRERGLWQSGSEPLEFSDLWADIDYALGQLSTWLDNSEGADNRYSLLTDMSREVSILSSFERVALWGTTL